MLLVASIRLWDRLLLLLLLLMRIKWNWFELCRLCGKSWINSFHIQLIMLRGYSRNLLLLHLEILRLVLLWLKLLALIVEHNNFWINNRHWLRTTSINLLLWRIAVEKKIEKNWLIELVEGSITSASSITGKESEKLTECMSSINTIRMIIWAMGLSTWLTLSTSMHFIVQRMVLLFLPSMRKATSIFISATIRICLNEMFCLPLLALFSFIVWSVWFSSEILPIMRINASVSCMWGVAVGTPDCLEVEHVEIRRILRFSYFISCFIELMKKIYSDLIFRMSECAHITVIAWFYPARIALTEFHFVFFRMIEFLHTVMPSLARITHGTFVSMLLWYYIWTYFWSVSP